MPKTVIALVVGLLAFLGVVLAIAAWAGLGGGAGQQRGLVLTNATAQTVTVALADGQSRVIDPGDQATFVIRREDFPSPITVTTGDGAVLLQREFQYDYFAGAEFRVSFDENGFFRTTAVRATPERSPTSAD